MLHRCLSDLNVKQVLGLDISRKEVIMSGVSDNENKELAANWIKEAKPYSVLDIGAGMGIYSIMAKQKGQHWTAIEVFAPYINMFNLRSRYDEIIVTDARYANYEKIGNFDLIIVADMLEHMTKDESSELVMTLLQYCHNLLICFPIIHHEQHAGLEGNDFETHIDHWTEDEMRELLKNRQIEHEMIGEVLAYFFVRGDA